MLNLSTLLESSAQSFPEKQAFVFGESSFNYSQINGAANQIANGLKSQGIGKGDHVALSCLNLPYFPMIYFGILKAGATVVPLSVLLKKDEISYHLSDSNAVAYFCFEGTEALPMGTEGYSGFQEVDGCKHFFMITGNPAAASPIDGVQTLGMLMKDQSPVFDTVQTSAEDTALIVYTSGITGNPKGAELSHSNLMTNAILSAGISEVQFDDTQLIVLPLFHIFAMTVLMNAGIYKGATSVLLPRFEAESVLGLMQKHKVNVFAGVPTMYWGLINYENTKFDLAQIKSYLKICISGGASLPVQLLNDFEEKFEVDILEGYGMSEGSPVVTFNHKHSGRKPGSIGTPAWGVEVKVVDDQGQEVAQGKKGQLIYRGPNVMKGYYNMHKETQETIKNGWLHSGDIAIKDEDGFYFIVDRIKEMIIRGGLNVYPREIEEVMMKHPAISLVAVVGEPDEKLGEEIKAYVVLKEAETATSDELIQFTKDKIASYKYPRIIEFRDTLPMSATGKLLKKELKTT